MVQYRTAGLLYLDKSTYPCGVQNQYRTESTIHWQWHNQSINILSHRILHVLATGAPIILTAKNYLRFFLLRDVKESTWNTHGYTVFRTRTLEKIYRLKAFRGVCKSATIVWKAELAIITGSCGNKTRPTANGERPSKAATTHAVATITSGQQGVTALVLSTFTLGLSVNV